VNWSTLLWLIGTGFLPVPIIFFSLPLIGFTFFPPYVPTSDKIFSY